MKQFLHFNAKTIEEAVSLLDKYKGKAQIIAGGTDLLGQLKDRSLPTQPEVLVNIKTIPNLDYIKEDAEGLKVGALAKLYDIATSTVVQAKYGALAQAARAVGSNHLRHMGTIGGNLCQETRCWYWRLPWNAFFCLRKGGALCNAQLGDNRYHSIFGGPGGCYAASPSDTAPALMALNAKAKTSERTIPLTDFFKDTAPGHVLGPKEILTEIQVPTPPADNKQVFLKSAIRKAIDFALVSAAVFITPKTGAVTDARIALGAVGPKPIRATDAEAALKGKTVTAEVAESAAAVALAKAVALPMSKYKTQIAKALVKQAILA